MSEISEIARVEINGLTSDGNLVMITRIYRDGDRIAERLPFWRAAWAIIRAHIAGLEVVDRIDPAGRA